MSRISTKLTALLNLRTPLVCAPMAGAAGGTLAAAVSQAGGLGFIGYGYQSVQKLSSEVASARSVLQLHPEQRLPIGIGYLGWRLEQPDVPAEELLRVALESRAQAVWLSFGTQLDRWIKFIRGSEPEPGATKIFVQVSSVREALVAANDWKADVIVAQGVESGGHGSSTAPPLLTLLSEVLSAIPTNGPLILGAGGMAHGGHIASLLTLGASGAVLGTRFLLASESLYLDSQRKALIAASSASSVRTMAFDYVRNTLGWPGGVDGRGLINSTVVDFDNNIDLSILQRKYAEVEGRGDTDRIVTWAGTGVGLMNKVQSANDIVQEIHEEIVASIRSVASLLSSTEPLP